MKKLEIEIKGTVPLLMNNSQAVNPLHPLVKHLKTITSKRKRTEEDEIEILKTKWHLGIYWDDNVGVHIPSANIHALIADAAKSVKKGKTAKAVSAMNIKPNLVKLNTPKNTPTSLESLWENPEFADVRVGKLRGASSVLICRPRFNEWGLSFMIEYNENKFDRDELINIIKQAGSDIGICDYHGKFGLFEIVKVAEITA